MKATEDFASDSLRSSVSSPGMPNTYLTPSASRHSTKTSLARRLATTFTYPDPIRMSPDASTATLAPRWGSRARMRRTALVAVLCLALPAAAQAKSSFVIRGAGYGHGIGLSQYGADGYALHGYDYKTIIGHYYQGTGLSIVSPEPTIRVLLESATAPSFTGATSASGRNLDPAKTYSVVRAGANGVALRAPSGRKLQTFDGTLRVTGSAPLRLNGLAGNGVRNGRYR